MDSTKEKILTAAKASFAKQGYENTSIRDIAQLADVNVSAVNYHFESKANLFITICREFAETKVHFAYGLLRPADSLDELKVILELFYKSLLDLAEEDSDTAFIVLRNCELYAELAPDAFEKTFVRMSDSLADFFRIAQEKQLIRSELSPEIIANVITGNVSELLRMNNLRKKFKGIDIIDPEYKQQHIQNFVSLVIYGAKTE